jgi:hypothetical protein
VSILLHIVHVSSKWCYFILNKIRMSNNLDMLSSSNNLSFFVLIFQPCILFAKLMISYKYTSHDTSVGIALGYELDYRGSRIRFPAGAGNFSLH